MSDVTMRRCSDVVTRVIRSLRVTFCLKVIVLVALQHFVEGCSRRAENLEPPPTRRAATTPLEMEETTLPSHRLRCSPAEERDIRCLNGGECYVLTLHGEYRTLPQCSCGSDWAGTRCEDRYIDPIYYIDMLRAQTRHQILIGVGVSLLLLALLLASVFALVYWRRRRARGRQGRGTNGGAECPPGSEARQGMTEINGNGTNHAVHVATIYKTEQPSRIPLIALDEENL